MKRRKTFRQPPGRSSRRTGAAPNTPRPGSVRTASVSAGGCPRSPPVRAPRAPALVVNPPLCSVVPRRGPALATNAYTILDHSVPGKGIHSSKNEQRVLLARRERATAGCSRSSDLRRELGQDADTSDFRRNDIRRPVVPSQHLVRFGVVLDGPGTLVPMQCTAQPIGNVGQMHQYT